MKYSVLSSLVLVLVACQMSYAQFGLRAGLSNYQVELSQGNYSEWSPEIAGHYWFRLKETRIEFFPEISLAFFQHNEQAFTEDFPFKWEEYGISVPTRLYPLDFKSDCNCPTFSKQNDLVKKGLFVTVKPGFFEGRIRRVEKNGEAISEWIGRFDVDIGIGLDVGVSDLITITPTATYPVYSLSNYQEPLYPQRRINFGLTASFRPDY